MSKQIPLFWWSGEGNKNFGDVVSKDIVEYVSKKKAFLSFGMGEKILAVGSIIHLANNGDSIWGSGYIGTGIIPKNLKVYAVRGPKTRQVLLNSGIECPEVYGDPAILLPKIYKMRNSIKKEYKVGILPHYVDKQKTLSLIKNEKNINFIDVFAHPQKIITEINKCEVVLASSLHGVIVAEAYGVPAARYDVGGPITGGDFKYEDYYLSTDREPKKLDWTNGYNLDNSIEFAKRILKPRFESDKLIQSFPTNLFS